MMIRRFALTIALLCCTIAAQASGETIGIGNFHAISTRGNIHLIIAQSSDSSSTLEVEYHNIKQNDFTYKVRAGVLYLDVPSGLLERGGFVKIIATTPRLEQINSEGATIECATPIKNSSFNFVSTGSVNIVTLCVEVDQLSINVGGQSDVMVSGSATEANLSAKFGSRIDAFALHCNSAVAKASDGSEIYLRPKVSLKAKATLSGTIYYMETPTVEPKSFLWGDIVLVERAQLHPMFFDHSKPNKNRGAMQNVAQSDSTSAPVEQGAKKDDRTETESVGDSSSVEKQPKTQTQPEPQAQTKTQAQPKAQPAKKGAKTQTTKETAKPEPTTSTPVVTTNDDFF